jgi:hypothetical protein
MPSRARHSPEIVLVDASPQQSLDMSLVSFWHSVRGTPWRQKNATQQGAKEVMQGQFRTTKPRYLQSVVQSVWSQKLGAGTLTRGRVNGCHPCDLAWCNGKELRQMTPGHW